MEDVPKGYKETGIGIIPEDWEVKELGKISDVKSSTRVHQKDWTSEGIPFYRAREIVCFDEKREIKDPIYISHELYERISKKYNVPEMGDVLITGVGTIGVPHIVNTNEPFYFKDGNIIWISKLKQIIPYWLYTCLKTDHIMKNIKNEVGSTVKTFTIIQAKNLQIPLPPLKEQQKIAEILSTWDNSIENLENLISKKIEIKKGLMQNLLTGNVRFPGFEDEWKDVKLGDILNEFSEKTHENNQHMILSVTKTGIIPQSEQFNKQVASSDNAGYKILRYGNLVFSSMNLWMGSLDILRTYEIGIVSPAYKTFKINYSLVDIDFIQDFLKSKHMIWIYNINSEQGASIVRRNLDLDGLLSTKIMLPELREQQKIGKMLSTQDKEIDLLKQKLELVKTQKKGLMQNLLTGKVRVNV